jgi:DNA repair ATPase RecN
VNNIENNVTLIYSDTQYLVDQLNCNGTIDTPICAKLDAMNLTIEEIKNITLGINYTINSINNSIYVMNQSIHNRFDSIDGNISVLINTTNFIQDLVNCTNISAQSVNSTCNRLDRIETYSLTINTTVNSILNVVNYINSTRWINYTVQDILDAIDNISISSDFTQVLIEIQRLREFDEELVFLVTDAFNAQQRARDATERGDLNEAMANLNTARTRLDQATERLGILRAETEEEAANSSYWIVWLILTVLIGAVVIFLFQRVPEEPPRTF